MVTSTLRWLTATATRAGLASLTASSRWRPLAELLGFVREVLISSQYGTTSTADSFFAIQQIPTIVSTFVIGPFMIAYVPLYAKLRREGFASEGFARSAQLLLRVGVAITIGMIVVGSLVLRLQGPADQSPVGGFLVIMAFAVVPILVAGLATVVLHAEGHHVLAMGVAALAPGGCSSCCWF